MSLRAVFGNICYLALKLGGKRRCSVVPILRVVMYNVRSVVDLKLDGPGGLDTDECVAGL